MPWGYKRKRPKQKQQFGQKKKRKRKNENATRCGAEPLTGVRVLRMGGTNHHPVENAATYRIHIAEIEDHAGSKPETANCPSIVAATRVWSAALAGTYLRNEWRSQSGHADG